MLSNITQFFMNEFIVHDSPSHAVEVKCFICIETNFILNYDKCQFMVDHCIVLSFILVGLVLILFRVKYVFGPSSFSEFWN